MYIGNPFKVLGVADNSDVGVCKKAFRKLSREYHPDSPNGNAEKFDSIVKAFEAIENKDFYVKGALHIKKKLTHDTLFRFSVV